MFGGGWVENERAVAEACEYLARSGAGPVYSDSEPQLKGHWERLKSRGVKGMFLWQWEREFFGKLLPADAQYAPPDEGTCVGRGTYRAIQDTLGTALSLGLIVGRPVLIAYEPIYAGSRVESGRGAIQGGGSNGGWAAQFVHRYGVIERKQYGSIDLSKSREDLASRWGRMGVPQELKAESANHIVPSAFYTPDTSSLADCLAAGYAGTCCSRWAFGGRDQNGESRYSGPTAHCEEWCGVYVRQDGSTGFVRRNSHGDNVPGGPRVLGYAGGSVELPWGGYGVSEQDAAGAMATGENWTFGVVGGFRPNGVSDMLGGGE